MKLIDIQLAAACVIAASFTAAAQDQLNKEITIEREIVPEVRAAQRPAVFPGQLSFRTEATTLPPHTYTAASRINPEIATLQPTHTQPANPLTPYRGYIDLGYFPTADIGVSAGYAPVSTETTGLNLWAQFNNNHYKSSPLNGMPKGSFSHLKGTIGVGFAHRFGTAGTLSLNTDVAFASFNQPWSVIEKSAYESETPAYDTEAPEVKKQSTFGWNFGAQWEGTASNSLTYHIGAGFNLFNFSKGMELDEEETIAPVHQTGFNLSLGVNEKLGEESSVGLDIDGQFLHYNHFISGLDAAAVEENPEVWLAAPGKTPGIATLNPYYRFGNSTASVKVGALVQFTFNSGKKFHIAPDVLLGINPAAGFGASLRVSGGEKLNSLQELSDFSPYISQMMAYGASHRPITADLALRFGPLSGASITLDLGYAAANDWLLPMAVSNQLLFAPTDLRAMKAGATARWSYKKLLVAEASFATVFGNEERRTWIEWRDRARHVASAAVTVNPIDRLSVNLSYELRMKRSMPVAGIFATDGPESDTEAPQCFNLKDISNLNVGATYRITPALTAFANFDNLLNRRTYLMPLVPARGFSGLFGIGYKF